MPATEPALFGPTSNPWSVELTPGGSSGGSAAAVASGMVPMAYGNDGGGSLRIPASCCGLFGLKPTRGRNPMGPLFGDLAGGIVHEHVISRSVRDSAALLDATAGPDLGDPYCAPPAPRPFLEEVEVEPGHLRIGFLTSVPEGWSDELGVHPDCDAAVRDAAEICEALGHGVEEASPAGLAWPGLVRTFRVVFSCLVGQMVDYWERELRKTIARDELEPLTWDLYQAGLGTTGPAYLRAQEELQRFARNVATWYEKGRYDVLLSPTMRIPPPKTGSFHPTPDDPRGWRAASLSFMAFTRTQNITGQPAMSVPLYWNAGGIPIGVQFAGRFGEEAMLFRLAGQLERARPWAGRRPLVHCSRT